MDVVPQIMNYLRDEMRRNRVLNLSVPQFRTLIFLYRHPNASLSEVADYIGLKLPSMSKMVNTLVVRKMIIRRASGEDRRYIRLRLSAIGVEELKRSRHRTEKRLAEVLAVLRPEQQSAIREALQILRPLFIRESDSTSAAEK